MNNGSNIQTNNTYTNNQTQVPINNVNINEQVNQLDQTQQFQQPLNNSMNNQNIEQPVNNQEIQNQQNLDVEPEKKKSNYGFAILLFVLFLIAIFFIFPYLAKLIL